MDTPLAPASGLGECMRLDTAIDYATAYAAFQWQSLSACSAWTESSTESFRAVCSLHPALSPNALSARRLQICLYKGRSRLLREKLLLCEQNLLDIARKDVIPNGK